MKVEGSWRFERFLDVRADADALVEATAQAVADQAALHGAIAESSLFIKRNNDFVGGNVPGAKPSEVGVDADQSRPSVLAVYASTARRKSRTVDGISSR